MIKVHWNQSSEMFLIVIITIIIIIDIHILCTCIKVELEKKFSKYQKSYYIAVDSEGSQLARELPSGITESKKIIM